MYDRCSIRIVSVLIFAVLFAFLPASAGAGSILEFESRSQPQPSSIWKSRVGSGFRKDIITTGLTVGTGFGVKIFGGKESHDLMLVCNHMGWMATDVVYENQWYRGNLELWGEIFAGGQYDPESAYVFGLTIGPRYYFVTNSRWVPFMDAGAGVSGTNIGEPDLSTKFQFNIQLGIGTHYFFKDSISLTMQTRGIHLSNANLKMPNNGVNSILFLVGVSCFF